MTSWIIYRKGSFFLKERLESEARFQERKSRLEQSGATDIGIIRDPENNPWLKRAFELPAPLGRAKSRITPQRRGSAR